MKRFWEILTVVLAAWLLIVLLVLPVRAELEVEVDGQPYVSLVQVKRLLGRQNERLTLLERHVAQGPIYTALMLGDTFTERFEQAIGAVQSHRGEKAIHVEGGWLAIDRPIELPALDGVAIQGQNSRIFWGEEIPDHYPHAMITVAASFRQSITGIKLIGKNIKTQEDVTGDVGIIDDAGWRYNRNTARGRRMDVDLYNFDIGAVCGSSLAPDVTRTHWFGTVHQCSVGFQCEGGNLASYIFEVDLAGRKLKHALEIKYCVPEYFAQGKEPRCLDQFGQPVAVDAYDSDAWRSRIFDSKGRNGNHPDFDKSTARTQGGGPDVTLRDFNVSFGANESLAGRSVVLNHGGSYKLVRGRIEGDGIVEVAKSITNNPNMHAKRFDCLVQDVHCHYDKEEPFDIERKGHDAGFARHIVRGYYSNPKLPPQSDDISKGIVTWDKPRGPQGVIR